MKGLMRWIFASAAVLAVLLCCSFPCLVRGADSPSPNKASGSWPQQFGPRKLHPWQYGFVYARNKSVAGQVQKILETAIKDAGKDGMAGPTAGLVIVMDTREELPFDVDRLLEAWGKVKTREADAEAEKARKSLAEAKQNMEKEGLDVATVLSIVPLPIAPAVLRQVAGEFPEDVEQQIAWCVVVPTAKCIKAGFKKIIDVGMKKEKPGLAKRAAIAAMMPVIERKVVAQMKKAQQATVYQFLVDAQKQRKTSDCGQATTVDEQRISLATFALEQDLRRDI
jgi:nucleotide-binding universal stress UspA family protein